MQIKVEKGRGYVPATTRRSDDGRSHRQHRARRVVLAGAPRELCGRSARVEQRTDLDKLVMDIETNGAIDPEEAVRYAARILVEQLSVFAALEGPGRAGRGAEAPRRSTRSCCGRWTTSS